MIIAGRAVLADARTWIPGGGLLIERGSVRRVLMSRGAVLRRRAQGTRVLDLENLVLAPGLVNAHAHLDLGALRGRTSGRDAFQHWIRALLQAKAKLSRRDFESAVRASARDLLATGTTAVGDIDGSGASARLGPGLGLRITVYRELLDAWDPTRVGSPGTELEFAL